MANVQAIQTFRTSGQVMLDSPNGSFENVGDCRVGVGTEQEFSDSALGGSKLRGFHWPGRAACGMCRRRDRQMALASPHTSFIGLATVGDMVNPSEMVEIARN